MQSNASNIGHVSWIQISKKGAGIYQRIRPCSNMYLATKDKKGGPTYLKLSREGLKTLWKIVLILLSIGKELKQELRMKEN